MFAVYAETFSSDDPLSGLVRRGAARPGRRPTAGPRSTVKAASLNHHDLWSLRGVGLKRGALPMILGCDAAGLDEDGNEVVVHAVISDPSWTGRRDARPEAVAALRALPGHASPTRSSCPRRNVVPKPAVAVSFEEAACLPTAWLTAYRMLFTQGGLQARRHRAGAGRRRRRRHRADRAGPGRRACGCCATSRDEAKRAARARARRARGLRDRRPAARAGRRRDGDRRPGDLVALDQVAAARRHARHLRHDLRAERSTTPSSPGSSSCSCG